MVMNLWLCSFANDRVHFIVAFILLSFLFLMLLFLLISTSYSNIYFGKSFDFLNFNSYLQCVCLWFSCLLAIFVWISMGRQRMRVTDLTWVVENACKMCTFVEFQMDEMTTWIKSNDSLGILKANVQLSCNCMEGLERETQRGSID